MDVSLLTFCGHAEVGPRFEVPYFTVLRVSQRTDDDGWALPEIPRI